MKTYVILMVSAFYIPFAGANCGEVLSQTTLPANVITEIRQALQDEMKAQQVPGLAVSIAMVGKNGRASTAYTDAFGIAEVKEDGSTIKVESDTKFRIASNSKIFTATALIRLLKSGRYRDRNGKLLSLDTKIIDIDTPLFRHIHRLQREGALSSNELWADVTIDQLLHHTSGINLDFYGRDKWYDYATAATGREMNEAEFLENLTKIDFAFAPGDFPERTRERYSNVGFGFLGAIIGQLTMTPQQAGSQPYAWVESFQNYVNKSIFKPLGMEAAYDLSEGDSFSKGYSYPRAEGEAVAPGEIRYEGRIQHPDVLIPGVYAPAIGVATTAEAMARYMSWQLNALSNKSKKGPISPKALRDMVEGGNVLSAKKLRSRGYFWQYIGKDTQEKDILILGHTGMERAHMSLMYLIPEYGVGIFIVGNPVSLNRNKLAVVVHNVLQKNNLLKPTANSWIRRTVEGIKAALRSYSTARDEALPLPNDHIVNKQTKNIIGKYESRLYQNAELILDENNRFVFMEDPETKLEFQQVADPGTPCHPYAYVVVSDHFYRGDKLRFSCNPDGSIKEAILVNGSYYQKID